MRLREIFDGIDGAELSGDAEISGIANDSRKVGKGDLFFAIAGLKADGGSYIEQALRNGAAAVASANPVPDSAAGAFPEASWVRVPDALKAFSRASAAFFGHPSRGFKLTGITGTNGKTTTAYLLESIYALAGAKPGVLGTINHRVDGKVLSDARNTTPPASELHSLFRSMADAGAKAVVMEVSSHALALNRADEAAFDVAVFTNLQRDHLDYHKDRESYFRAKLRLFELLSGSPKADRTAVVNLDDDRADDIISSLPADLSVATYGIDGPADFRAENIGIFRDHTEFTLRVSKARHDVRLNLLGRHNICNALAAIAAAVSGGIALGTAIAGAGALRNVPGRLERVDRGQPFTVFVDYAHTDAALENVLANLARLPHEKIITVFGCGGDRDRTKRAPMAEAAASMSDHVFVTSDNPRGEAPERIFSDIEAGLKGRFSNYRLVPDRREAIFEAIGSAGAGDIVLIAGKGHETFQIFGDAAVPFDDRDAAGEAIARICG